MRKLIICFYLITTLLACSKSETNDMEPIPEVSNTAPTVPIILYPTNGQLCTDNPLEFRWQLSTDNEGDVINYELELAKNQDFKDIVEKRNVTTTTFSLILEKGIQLNWRVRARDSKGEFSDYSPSGVFYTEGDGLNNYLPFSPSLVYPKNYSKIEGVIVKLEWTSIDVDDESLVYDIYFGETSPPSLLKENSPTSNLEVNINQNKTYYWQIVVKDEKGGESIGDIWQFKS